MRFHSVPALQFADNVLMVVELANPSKATAACPQIHKKGGFL
jgi:hypothetical protein